MKSLWESKKRDKPQEVQQGKTQRSQPINEGDTFYPWKFGTIHIRTGNEKDDGYKMYSIAKEAAKAKLQVCCLQEVQYRNIVNKVIALNNDESYTFFWSGKKKSCNACFGILNKKD